MEKTTQDMAMEYVGCPIAFPPSCDLVECSQCLRDRLAQREQEEEAINAPLVPELPKPQTFLQRLGSFF